MSGGLLDPARLARLRQKQETSFTPIFLHRPLAILFLIPTADVKWITPNGLTTVSILMRLVTAWLMLPHEFHGPRETTATMVIAALLWHLGSVLDAMDGALARYRKTSSALGRYYDKVSDRVLSLALVLALTLRPLAHDGDVLPLILGAIYVSLTGTASVAKWIEIGIRADMKLDGSAADPEEVGAPKRSFLDWVKYLAWSARTIVVVSEVDLPLWGSIAFLTGTEKWLFYYLGAFIVPYTLGALFVRGYRLHQIDVERARAAR
jgi:phosphatidylglycerophosphate synthase